MIKHPRHHGTENGSASASFVPESIFISWVLYIRAEHVTITATYGFEIWGPRSSAVTVPGEPVVSREVRTQTSILFLLGVYM